MITDIEDFFAKGCGRCERFATPDCSARLWAGALAGLRRICLGAGLAETVKWGHPCYMHAGRNVALIGALRSDVRLNFFNAALMTDPAGVLERQGPNTRHPDSIVFRDAGRVAALEPVIAAYLAEAMAYAEEGRLPPKEPGAVELPADLTDALDADPEMAEAFHALTPGRQRSYVIALSSSQVPATRAARIARLRPAILAGKGANER
jgi:uncharacterized protein YdeI (YjbR/CyaY-like superfamily)